MDLDQIIVFATLALTLVLFVTGRWRYDVVALMALFIVVVTGVVPVQGAFSGFSNPAVVTVAAVLVLSQGLQNSGIVDVLGQALTRLKGGITVQLFALTIIVAVLSAFMNNVGALALLLPVAIALARRKNIPVSYLLMPLAFASLLGGMTTLIGTPPNIIAASFREQATGVPFSMFDFTPVGAGAAIAGILFIALLGWRLIPLRKGAAAGENLFQIENYVTELRITESSQLNGRRLNQVRDFTQTETLLLGLVRNQERRMEPSAQMMLRRGDILIVSGGAENLENLVETARLELVGNKKISRADLESDEVSLVEGVVKPNSLLVGGTARSLNLRKNYGVNLLAISREGQILRTRFDRTRLREGDVLLMQSHVETLNEVLGTLGCLPLARRELRLGQPRKIVLGLSIFLAALLISAFGWLPVQVAFFGGVLLMVIFKLLSLREAYDSVDWPIIMLLGAMIPLGEALETTGGAQLIANGLLGISSEFPPALTLVIILVGTMFLSDVVNNAAAVVLMAPIAIRLATSLGVAIDPFLMAITIGASCAFLTPIGHQSNTLVMGPGGYKFGDYWRMGLILEVIIVLVCIPLILIFWPL